jgi:hypothetical protein
MSHIARPYEPGSEVYLPAFPYLLPALCHADASTIRHESSQWVSNNMRFALDSDQEMEELLEEGAALWTCYVLPTASRQRLRLLCDYTEYLSVFDNAMVDRAKIGSDLNAAKQLFARVVNILEDQAIGSDFEYGRVLKSIWSQMRPEFSEPHWDRFMAEVRRFLSGCVSEIASRQGNAVFDFDTYVNVRRDSVGMGMYFVLGEYGLGIDLTDRLEKHAELREIIDIALEHIMLTNDIFSFRAESEMDDYVNALAVLRLSEGMSLQAAMDRLFTIVEGKRMRFMAARDGIESGELGADAEIRTYLAALWHMMAGNLQWSYLTSRYNGVGHHWNGLTSGVLTLHPDRTVFTGLPYRSVWTQ